MSSLVMLLLFLWLLGVIGGGHVRTGGLVHLVLLVALVGLLTGAL